MDSDIVPAVAAVKPPPEGVAVAFARLLRQRYHARVFLFGSRARGTNCDLSDYDFVAVSDAFLEQPLLHRAPDRRDLWRRAGGWGLALDLHCFSRAEFRTEIAGVGYLAQAKGRGELRELRVGRVSRRRSGSPARP